MTVIAIRAKVSFVYVVSVMAVDTTTIHFFVFFQRSEVAGMTMQPFMRTSNLEVSFIMIKIPDQPVVRVVA